MKCGSASSPLWMRLRCVGSCALRTRLCGKGMTANREEDTTEAPFPRLK